MKYKELKALSKTDREKRLKEAKIELLKINAQVATGTTPKSPGKIAQLKRLIAQINTFEHAQEKAPVKESIKAKPQTQTTNQTEESPTKNG